MRQCWQFLLAGPATERQNPAKGTQGAPQGAARGAGRVDALGTSRSGCTGTQRAAMPCCVPVADGSPMSLATTGRARLRAWRSRSRCPGHFCPCRQLNLRFYFFIRKQTSSFAASTQARSLHMTYSVCVRVRDNNHFYVLACYFSCNPRKTAIFSSTQASTQQHARTVTCWKLKS